MKSIFEYLLTKSSVNHVKPQSRAKWLGFWGEGTTKEYKEFVDHIIEEDAYDILDNFDYWIPTDDKLHMAYNHDCKYEHNRLFGIQFIVDINEFTIEVVPAKNPGPVYDVQSISDKICKSIVELEETIFNLIEKIDPMKK